MVVANSYGTKNYAEFHMNKIVPVRLLNRQTDHVILEINGEKFQAKATDDFPDYFLAHASVKKVSSNKVEVQLKMIDTIHSQTEFRQWVQQQSIERITDYLMTQSVPLTKNNIYAAELLMKSGLGLFENRLRMISRALSMKNSALIDLILNLFQQHFTPDMISIDMILNRTCFFKQIQESKRKIGNIEDALQKLFKDEDNQTLIFKNLLHRWLFNGKGEFDMTDYQDDDDKGFLSFHHDDEDKNISVFTVEIESETNGSHLLKIYSGNNGVFRISVFLDPQIYLERFDRKDDDEKKLSSLIENKLKKKIKVDMNQRDENMMFCSQNQKNDADSQMLLNLDIQA